MANEAPGCVGEWDIRLANDDSYSEEGEGRGIGSMGGGVGEWRWYLGAEGPVRLGSLHGHVRQGDHPPLTLSPSCKIGTK